VVGLVWVFKLDKVKLSLRPYLNREFAAKYSTDESFTRTWDHVQSENRCCGVDGPLDFHLLSSSYSSLPYSDGSVDAHQSAPMHLINSAHLIRIQGESGLLSLPDSCCTFIYVPPTVSSGGSSSHSVHSTHSRSYHPHEKDFATSARLVGVHPEPSPGNWSHNPPLPVKVSSKKHSYFNSTHHKNTSGSSRSSDHHHRFRHSLHKANGAHGTANYSRETRDILYSFARRIKPKLPKAHINDSEASSSGSSNNSSSGVSGTNTDEDTTNSSKNNGPPVVTTPHRSTPSLSDYWISFACNGNTSFGGPTHQRKRRDAFSSSEELVEEDPFNSDQSDNYAVPSAFTLWKDDPLVIDENGDNESFSMDGFIHQKVAFRHGCGVKLIQWVDQMSSLLFIFGFCVIGFIKLCFLVILRCEIHEMIQKINLIDNEVLPPPPPSKMHRGSAIPHPHHYNRLVSNPCLLAHRASTVSSQFNSALPTIRSPDIGYAPNICGAQARGFNRNYYMRRASTNIIGDRIRSTSHSQETVNMTLLIANVETNRGRNNCGPLIHSGGIRRSSQPTSSYTLHHESCDEEDEGSVGTCSYKSQSRLSIPVPSSPSKSLVSSLKSGRNSSSNNNVTSFDDTGRPERITPRKVSLPAENVIGQYCYYHPDSYTFHRAPMMRSQLKNKGINNLLTSPLSPRRNSNSSGFEFMSEVSKGCGITTTTAIVEDNKHSSGGRSDYIMGKSLSISVPIEKEESNVEEDEKRLWANFSKDGNTTGVHKSVGELVVTPNKRTNGNNNSLMENEGIPLAYLGTAV